MAVEHDEVGARTRGELGVTEVARETVAALVERSARTAPTTVALVDPSGASVTYHDLVVHGRRLGRWLLAQGLRPGDRVALWLGDVAEHVQAYVACALSGVVAVPVSTRFTEHEAHHLVTDSGARLLVHGADTADRVAALCSFVPDVRAVQIGSWPDLVDLVADESADPLPVVEASDVLAIGYTSGTTGPPKGAVLTQGSVAVLAG